MTMMGAVDPAQIREAVFGLDCCSDRDRDLPVFAFGSAAASGLELLRRALYKKEVPMTLTALSRATALAATIATGMTAAAAAQTTAVDPHHPHSTTAQATPPAEPGDATGQDQQGAQPAQPGMMPPGMMGQGMMGQAMMGGMPMVRMHGHIMKIMFAIADTNGDGGLSFEEITTIQKRIFDKVDADKDGKVTPEEVQTFMRE